MREPVWIDEPDTLALHNRLLALDGGAAAARYEWLHAAGIIRNRSFIDGNKRTGFLVGAMFLEMNGYRLTASEEDATQAVLGLAAGTLEEGAFTAWLRGNVARESSRKNVPA